MYGIRFRTLGRVAFRNRMKMSSGYRCDVPVDDLGFPCLPLAEMMQDTPLPVPDAQIGFARPEGYLGLVREAADLEKSFPNDREMVREIYTTTHFSSAEGTNIRALKSGLTFTAPLKCRDEDVKTIRAFLRTVKRIGTLEEGVTGEVEMELCDLDREPGPAVALSPLCRYISLEYAIHLHAPACIYAPYEDDADTYPYIPGAEIRKRLEARARDGAFLRMLEEMTFTHATVSLDGRRMYPVPLSMSVVKLDREQLHDRLSEGKDPSRVEQDVGLSGAYAGEFGSHFMRYTRPMTERISLRDGNVYDALSAGQTFRGLVYGTDEQIRALAEEIRKQPRLRFGKGAEEGYGAAYMELVGAQEEAIRTEEGSPGFEVACVSNTLLLNDDGIPSCRAEELLREIEDRLGIPGGLEIVGKFTDVCRDFEYRFDWDQDGPVVRCLKAGSILRLRTRDGRPVNLYPIRHCFVGENTRNGYGELIAWPAGDLYYRAAEQAEPSLYRLEIPLSYTKAEKGARLVLSVLQRKLKTAVRLLAVVDRGEYHRGVSAEELIPMELLKIMKETYAPGLDDEIVVQWYREGLEDEKYV